VISNAIRASIASRKEEIVVMEMIGATPSMIRKPFLAEGAILGFVSSLIAVIVCFGIYLGVKNVLIEKLSFLQLSQHVQFLNISVWVVFVVVGTGLGALASYLCVRRINDGFAGSRAGY
jgi:cell division transport system permease protein